MVLTTGALSLSYYVHTKTLDVVPVTGRRRHIFVSPELESRLGDAALENFVLGVKAAQSQSILAPSILPQDHPASITIRRIGDRLVDNLPPEFSEHKARKWTYLCVDDPSQPNAFALPGAHVVVFTGLFKFSRDEDELASVLAHEIAHVLARHPAEKTTKLFFLATLGALFESVFGYSPLARIVEKLAFELPFSRTMELEADVLGLHFMSSSCFECQKATVSVRRKQTVAAHVHPPP